MSNFSRIRGENQFVFFNTGLIVGINSLSIQNNFAATPIKYIGIGNKSINQSASSAQYADLNISSNLIQEDFLMEQTGLQPFNCFIFQDSTNANTCYSLISGYLNSYSSKYVSNQVPQTQATFRFYNNAGNINQSNLDPYSSGQISSITTNTYPIFNGNIADSNYINLTVNEGVTNRVQSFDFSLQFSRLPIYNIGSRFPKRVETIYPLNIEATISFEPADNFSDVSLTDFPLNKIQQNISLAVYSNRTNNLIATYSFNNFTLISNERSLNTENNLVINRKYVGQLFNFVNASGAVPPGIWDWGSVANSIDFFMDFGAVNSVPTGSYDFGGIP